MNKATPCRFILVAAQRRSQQKKRWCVVQRAWAALKVLRTSNLYSVGRYLGYAACFGGRGGGNHCNYADSM